MGASGRALVAEHAVNDILAELDSFYAYEMVAVHWALAVHNRLEGMAVVLLAEEFEKRAEAGLDNARRIAARMGQLGGAITGDPTRFIELAPVHEFSLPASGADPRAILSDALKYERLFVEGYAEFCRRYRDDDIVSYEEAVHLLKDHVQREDDLEMALAGSPSRELAGAGRT
jgi:ferritin-like protein